MYRSRPKPKGCCGVAARWARLPPRRSRPWLPESATECTDSASIDDDPLKRNATNFATAIERLASSAATIALVPPDALMCRVVPSPASASSSASVRRRRGAAVTGFGPSFAVRHCCSPCGPRGAGCPVVRPSDRCRARAGSSQTRTVARKSVPVPDTSAFSWAGTKTERPGRSSCSPARTVPAVQSRICGVDRVRSWTPVPSGRT